MTTLVRTERPSHKRGREPGITLPFLRAWRRKGYLSQRDLAAMACRSPAHISAIECGGPASFSTVRLLAKALEITPERLVTEDPGDTAD